MADEVSGLKKGGLTDFTHGTSPGGMSNFSEKVLVEYDELAIKILRSKHGPRSR